MKHGTAVALAAALATTLGGCVGPRAISRRAVSYNTAVEQARGEMLLLNVLRSRDRRMMVFTGLTRITGSVRSEARVGVTGNADALERASIGPSWSVSDAPTFDMAVLDSQEFTRGIMTPLSFELLEYFWDQGFVREILLLMTIERIEIACPTGSDSEVNSPSVPRGLTPRDGRGSAPAPRTGSDGEVNSPSVPQGLTPRDGRGSAPAPPTGGSRQAEPGARALEGSVANARSSAPEPPTGELRELQNDPQDPTFPVFRQVVNEASRSGAWEADEHLNEEIGPPVEAAEAARLGTLIQAASGRLRVSARKDGRFQLVRPAERLRLTMQGFDPCAGPYGAPVPESRAIFYDTKRSFETAAVEGHVRRARLVARSPQSVIFYLGEMARPGREIVLSPRSPGQPETERRLFVVREGSQCPGGPVAATYDGKRYVVPGGEGDCHPGRSLQALALAAQLLSLQQSSRDLPAAGTVRIIGQ